MVLRLAIIIIAVLGGLAVWLHFIVGRTLRRQLRALAESACRSCGARYGSAAAAQARQEYLARCDEARRQRPDLRINFARFWDARCLQCGSVARFNYETESLDELIERDGAS
jgi:hypothetical protein